MFFAFEKNGLDDKLRGSLFGKLKMKTKTKNEIEIRCFSTASIDAHKLKIKKGRV